MHFLWSLRPHNRDMLRRSWLSPAASVISRKVATASSASYHHYQLPRFRRGICTAELTQRGRTLLLGQISASLRPIRQARDLSLASKLYRIGSSHNNSAQSSHINITHSSNLVGHFLHVQCLKFISFSILLIKLFSCPMVFIPFSILLIKLLLLTRTTTL